MPYILRGWLDLELECAMSGAEIKINDPEIGDPWECQWTCQDIVSDRRLIAVGCPVSWLLRLLVPLFRNFVQISPSHVVSEGIQLREGIPVPIEIPKYELWHPRVKQCLLHSGPEDGRGGGSFLCSCLGTAVAIHHEEGYEFAMLSHAKSKMYSPSCFAHFEKSISDRRVLKECVGFFADCSDSSSPLSVGVSGASDELARLLLLKTLGSLKDLPLEKAGLLKEGEPCYLGAKPFLVGRKAGNVFGLAQEPISVIPGRRLQLQFLVHHLELLLAPSFRWPRRQHVGTRALGRNPSPCGLSRTGLVFKPCAPQPFFEVEVEVVGIVPATIIL